MNCTRRNFLIGGSTTLFLSGFFPKISFASMQKKNLIVFDIDDTLTKSEDQHQTAYVSTMHHFGITNINQNWKTYLHHTDSYILKENYEIETLIKN